MPLESPAFPDGVRRAARTRPLMDRARLAPMGNHEDVGHELEALGDRSEQLGLRRPFAELLFERRRFLARNRLGQLHVGGQGLGPERIPRQVVDEVQEKTPSAPPPQIAEIYAPEREVRFDRPAVPLEERDEAPASPGSKSISKCAR